MRITIDSSHAIWPPKEYINKNIKNSGSTRIDFYSQRAKTIRNYTEQGHRLM